MHEGELELVSGGGGGGSTMTADFIINYGWHTPVLFAFQGLASLLSRARVLPMIDTV